MAKIHLIGGEKGGVGKSVLARLLTQYMLDKQIPFRAFDADQSHGALLRFYQDYSAKVSVNSFESFDAVIEVAAEHPEHQVIVDLAAQTSTFLDQWMAESGIAELAPEAGIKLKYWHVMDSGRDSVDLLQTLFQTYDDQLEYVLVLNQVRGDNFDVFSGHPVSEKATELGAEVIRLKRLHPPLMTKIDARSASFWAAMNWAEGESKFSLLERQRVKVWLKSAYDEIGRAL